MKNLLSTFLLIGLSFILTACGPIYETHYTYQPPHARGGKMCLNQCIQTRELCRMRCESAGAACRERSRMEAMIDYSNYRADREAAHLPMDRTFSSFYDDFGCWQHCSCAEPYNACYRNCGGRVIPHRECVAFCGSSSTPSSASQFAPGTVFPAE